METTPRKPRDVFLAAIKLPVEDREAYLCEACRGHQGLHERVSVLLQAQAEIGSFYEMPAQTVDQPITESPGMIVGPYQLIEQIGEGGMGSVWMAQQAEPVKRRVALKLIKPGMDSRQIIARFEAERQALALMDHPNIARVLDAGTTSAGRPYFVMDLVKGVPITTYCDEHHLTPRQRLELFILTCQAVHHAHQKGIIHRDLKPSNVLVALGDAGAPGVPKIIDFGVAKAAGQRLTEQTLVTGFGAIVGTLEYMSPEQAEINQLDIDTRSDIYSLGVLLYELLTGSPPFTRQELEKAGMLEMLRVIREQDPSKPSTKLSTAEGLPTLAANRGTEPAKLTKLVRGELDWIVMKALQKDRNRRYETANGFAMDVQRYLADEPVLACPPSAAYRIRKFVCRNKGPVIAASLIMLALVVGMIGTTVGLIEAKRHERLAEEARLGETRRAEAEAKERRRAETAEAEAKGREKEAKAQLELANALADFLQNDLLGQAGSRAQASRQFEPEPFLTVREALDRASNTLNERFKEPELEAGIRRTVGNAYRAVGEYERAVAELRQAAAILERLHGPEHPLTHAVRNQLAIALANAGRTADAIVLYEQLRDDFAKTLGPDDPNTLAVLHNLAGTYHTAGRIADAIALYEKARDGLLKNRGPEHHLTLNTLNYLALAYSEAGRRAEATALFQKVSEAQIKTLGPNHPDTLTTLNHLGVAYANDGKTAEAITLLEQVLDARNKTLGPQHPSSLASIQNLASVYRDDRRTKEALNLLEQVRDAATKTLGPEHPRTLHAINALARAYHDAGRAAEAVALHEQVREIRLEKLGPNHPDTLTTLNNLALAYGDTGRNVEAIGLLEQVRDTRVKQLGPDHPDSLTTLNNLALGYLKAARMDEAITLFEIVRDARTKVLGPDHPRTLNTLQNLASAYRRANQHAKSTPLYEQVLAARRRNRGEKHPETLRAIVNLAIDYRDTGRLAQAIPLLEQVYLEAGNRPALRMVGGALLTAYIKAGRSAEATALAKETLRATRKTLPAGSGALGNALAQNGSALLQLHAWDESEPILRECLDIRSRVTPDDWQTFSARSLLGAALMGQKKYVEAEPLLVQGYEGMRQRQAKIPPRYKVLRLREAAERLVQLYDAWGTQDQAREWRKKLETHRAAENGPEMQ